MRLAALASATLIVACGSGAAVEPAPRSASPELASLTVSYRKNNLGMNDPPHCPDWPEHQDNLVLAREQLTYSPDEIGRMAATGLVDHSRLDPSLLAVQPGVAVGSPTVPPADVTDWILASDCAFAIDVTNAGSVPVQIPRVGVRLTSAPTPNSATYRLVEFCSILRVTYYCGPTVGHGPTMCSFYGVELSLSNQPAGSDFIQAPSATDCPPVTLQPQQAITFFVGIFSRLPLIYHAVPILEVTTPTGSGIESFAALAAEFAFADPSQFTCYKLSGTTFVAWKQGAGAYDSDGNALQGGWCV